jgi:hypothetical protein
MPALGQQGYFLPFLVILKFFSKVGFFDFFDLLAFRAIFITSFLSGYLWTSHSAS